MGRSFLVDVKCGILKYLKYFNVYFNFKISMDYGCIICLIIL